MPDRDQHKPVFESNPEKRTGESFNSSPEKEEEVSPVSYPRLDNMLPPPPYSGMPDSKDSGDGGLKVKYLALVLLLLLPLAFYGGRALADRAAVQPDLNPGLAGTIIGSWILYKDNTGVGAYIHLNADGSLKLTEGRLGEWMVTEHRLVYENDSTYVEFYDADTQSWIRFMAIASEQNNELRLTYLE